MTHLTVKEGNRNLLNTIHLRIPKPPTPKRSISTPTIYTTEEIMDILKIKESLCYKLLRSGELRGFKTGKDWKVTREALQEYINKQMGIGGE